MKVVLVAPPSITVPPLKYGGTQRVVFWLAIGLSEQGHDVTILAKKGSYINDKINVIEIPDKITDKEVVEYLPESFDIVHFHIKLNFEPSFPYLQTLHGNCKNDEFLPQNISFVSKKHAQNHGGNFFVYNGLDINNFEFSASHNNYFSYIGKINADYKNSSYAVHLAKKIGFDLKLAGGWRPSFRSNINYLGKVGGQNKIDFLKNARALIFPTAWEEPMGLVVIESLACGAPVIVSDRGSMPELVSEEVGFVCKNEIDYINAIENIDQIDQRNCREYIENNFTHSIMTDNYLKLYKKILNNPENNLHDSHNKDLNDKDNLGYENRKKVSFLRKLRDIF
jgi:glycosyltransferase involved in cell wall biosynthesis